MFTGALPCKMLNISQGNRVGDRGTQRKENMVHVGGRHRRRRVMRRGRNYHLGRITSRVRLLRLSGQHSGAV